MRPNKRIWLFGGLTVPDGVALVRPRPPEDSRTPRVLLCGGDQVAPLATVLERLVTDCGGVFASELRADSTSDDWLRHGWLEKRCQDFAPTAVLLALEPAASVADQVLKKLADQAFKGLGFAHAGAPGARLMWLPSPAGSGLSARTYASWAARALAMVR